jgi:hypothetical protein
MLQIVGAVLVLVGVTLVSLGNPQQAIQTVAAELQD